MQTKMSTLAHRDHVFCGPMSEATAERMLAALEIEPGTRVIDVGCGKGELLVRAVERGAIGVGLDHNLDFLDAARTRAGAFAKDGRLSLNCTDAGSFRVLPASFDAALCLGATHALGGYRPMLRTLAKWVRPGGVLIAGEGYWRKTPDPGYLAALGAREEEMTDHAGNIALGVDEGWTPIEDWVASDEEWEEYEDRYVQTIEEYVAEHPEDPDSPAMLERIRAWRDAYLKWGKGTLGLGYYVFRR